MRDIRIHVGKGKSVPVKAPDEEWLKVFYEMEATLDEGEDPKAARLGIEHMIDQWIQEKIEAPKPVPKLDPAKLDTLPWLTYKKKTAEPGHSGWIKNPEYFTDYDDPVALDLARALTQSNGKLELGEYVYQLSGKDKQFLNRKPVKPNQAEAKKTDQAEKPRGKEKR